MGEEKRCKGCGNSIDSDGDFCSKCRIKPRRKFTSSEMKEIYRKGDVFMQQNADRMKGAMDNEAIQPPMPWTKD